MQSSDPVNGFGQDRLGRHRVAPVRQDRYVCRTCTSVPGEALHTSTVWTLRMSKVKTNVDAAASFKEGEKMASTTILKLAANLFVFFNLTNLPGAFYFAFTIQKMSTTPVGVTIAYLKKAQLEEDEQLRRRRLIFHEDDEGNDDDQVDRIDDRSVYDNSRTVLGEERTTMSPRSMRSTSLGGSSTNLAHLTMAALSLEEEDDEEDAERTPNELERTPATAEASILSGHCKTKQPASSLQVFLDGAALYLVCLILPSVIGHIYHVVSTGETLVPWNWFGKNQVELTNSPENTFESSWMSLFFYIIPSSVYASPLTKSLSEQAYLAYLHSARYVCPIVLDPNSYSAYLCPLPPATSPAALTARLYSPDAHQNDILVVLFWAIVLACLRFYLVRLLVLRPARHNDSDTTDAPRRLSLDDGSEVLLQALVRSKSVHLLSSNYHMTPPVTPRKLLSFVDVSLIMDDNEDNVNVNDISHLNLHSPDISSKGNVENSAYRNVDTNKNMDLAVKENNNNTVAGETSVVNSPRYQRHGKGDNDNDNDEGANDLSWGWDDDCAAELDFHRVASTPSTLFLEPESVKSPPAENNIALAKSDSFEDVETRAGGNNYKVDHNVHDDDDDDDDNDDEDDDNAMIDEKLQAAQLKKTQQSAQSPSSRVQLRSSDKSQITNTSLYTAPRFATAVFRLCYSAAAAVVAWYWFHSANFWPWYVGGTQDWAATFSTKPRLNTQTSDQPWLHWSWLTGSSATRHCWDLSGGLTVGMDADFDQRNTSLRRLFLMQASYHVHSGAFHLLSHAMLLYRRLKSKKSKMKTRRTKRLRRHPSMLPIDTTAASAYIRSLLQHILALMLISVAYIFSSLRRLGAIGMFAFDISSCFLHLLQLCINAPSTSILSRPLVVKRVYCYLVLPSFVLTRFGIWPLLWYSAVFESQEWLRQLENTSIQGSARVLRGVFHVRMATTMTLTLIYFQRLYRHQHLRRMLAQVNE